jgi:hypothetical protein
MTAFRRAVPPAFRMRNLVADHCFSVALAGEGRPYPHARARSDVAGSSKVRDLALTEEIRMWAQMITTRLKPGREGDLPSLIEQLQAVEQPGSGLVRSTAMQDQNDPGRVYMLVVFESEAKARAREGDPRREQGLQAARATMAEIFDGVPEFVDLTVVDEWSL